MTMGKILIQNDSYLLSLIIGHQADLSGLCFAKERRDVTE